MNKNICWLTLQPWRRWSFRWPSDTGCPDSRWRPPRGVPRWRGRSIQTWAFWRIQTLDIERICHAGTLVYNPITTSRSCILQLFGMTVGELAVGMPHTTAVYLLHLFQSSAQKVQFIFGSDPAKCWEKSVILQRNRSVGYHESPDWTEVTGDEHVFFVEKAISNNQAWIFLQGNFIYESIGVLDKILQDMPHSVSDSESTCLILDFSQVITVDSSSLLYLIRTKDDVQIRGYSLEFRNVPEDIGYIMELISLGQLVCNVW